MQFTSGHLIQEGLLLLLFLWFTLLYVLLPPSLFIYLNKSNKYVVFRFANKPEMVRDYQQLTKEKHFLSLVWAKDLLPRIQLKSLGGPSPLFSN